MLSIACYRDARSCKHGRRQPQHGQREDQREDQREAAAVTSRTGPCVREADEREAAGGTRCGSESRPPVPGSPTACKRGVIRLASAILNARLRKAISPPGQEFGLGLAEPIGQKCELTEGEGPSRLNRLLSIAMPKGKCSLPDG